MPSHSFTTFNSVLATVDQLVQVHGDLGRLHTVETSVRGGATNAAHLAILTNPIPPRGRRHNQDALHRVAIVVCVAAWQAYIDAIIREGLTATKPLAGSPRHVLTYHRLVENQAKTDLGRFNTPNGENVRRLILEALGFDVHNAWAWNAPRRRWTSQDTKTRMDEWLKIRHSVAHGFGLPNLTWLNHRGVPRLTLGHVKDCQHFFRHLVGQMDPALSLFLTAEYGIPAPW